MCLQYGGVSSASACEGIPRELWDGCKWRWSWGAGFDNPAVGYKRVACPAVLYQRSNCRRADDAQL